MTGTKVGKVDRVAGFLFYVDGAGGVFRTPMRGHKGSKSKVGQVKRPDKSMCWVDGVGNVVCRKR